MSAMGEDDFVSASGTRSALAELPTSLRPSGLSRPSSLSRLSSSPSSSPSKRRPAWLPGNAAVSVHQLTLPEIGLARLQHAKTSELWPVEVRYRRRRQPFERPNPGPAFLSASFQAQDAGAFSTTLAPIPHHPGEWRATIKAPLGNMSFGVTFAGTFVGQGQVQVIDAGRDYMQKTESDTSSDGWYESKAIMSGAYQREGPARNNAWPVIFYFDERHAKGVKSVYVELDRPVQAAIRLTPRESDGSVAFGGLSYLREYPGGSYHYRFRVVFEKPVRSQNGPLTSIGFDFAGSYTWGLATHWLEVTVRDLSTAPAPQLKPQEASSCSSENVEMLTDTDAITIGSSMPREGMEDYTRSSSSSNSTTTNESASIQSESRRGSCASASTSKASNERTDADAFTDCDERMDYDAQTNCTGRMKNDEIVASLSHSSHAHERPSASERSRDGSENMGARSSPGASKKRRRDIIIVAVSAIAVAAAMVLGKILRKQNSIPGSA